MSELGRRSADRRRLRAPGRGEVSTAHHRRSPEGDLMLWLIIGIVLLIIAIAGGTIVHPILFAIAILALLAFFAGRGGRTAL
jgi:hypothetical protein